MKAQSLLAFAALILCAGPSAAATVSSIPIPIPETYIQHDVSLQGANGQLGVNGTVTARLDTANTWALTQTFTLAPVFTDQPGTRTALGLVIGTNVEAWDADLDALAALSSTAGILKRTGAGAFGLAASGTDYAPATSGSAAQLGNGAGGFSAYTGTVCTGQFVRSLSSAIVATCNAVSLTADVTGVLPIANGGCNASTVAGCLTNLGVAAKPACQSFVRCLAREHDLCAEYRRQHIHRRPLEGAHIHHGNKRHAHLFARRWLLRRAVCRQDAARERKR